MILKKIGKKLGMVGASLVLMTAQMTPFFVFGGQASATPSGDVTICHATNSHTNPYTVNTVNQSSVDETNNQYLNGHGGHDELVVWYPGVADHSWGDIIPPFTNSATGTSFPGMNWTTEGMAIWDNGCVYPTDDVDPALPYVRVTYICKANFDGIALAWNGTANEEVPVNNGDYIWRFRYESANSDLGSPASVDYSTNYLSMTGDLDLDEIEFQTTASGAAGVKVSTVLGPNLYNGTASSNETSCEELKPALPYVRVTYICKANFDGIALAWNGTANEEVPVNNGDYIWRFRYESANSDLGSPASVDYSTNYLSMTGDLDLDEIEFQTTASGAAGVKVSTVLGPNLYNGTASSNETSCEELQPDPTVTVTKFVNNNYSGDTPANEFPVRLNGVLLTSGDLVEVPNSNNTNSAFETVTVEPGVEFVISEDPTEGYRLINITCKVGTTSLKKPFVPKEGDEVKCNVVNEDLPDPQIFATKIVCDDESFLPNWGAKPGGPNITSLTAIDWVTDNQGCKLAEGWNFEYAFNNIDNPGDNIEEGGLNWTPFGPTNSSGETSTGISEVEKVNRVWIREQLKSGYLGFTFNENSKTNVDSISAELYCNNDVLNYDNYDYISNPEYGSTYYCVAWNVELGQITAVKYNDRDGNGTRDAETEEKMDGWEMTIYDEEDEKVASGYTDEGSVTFDDLLPGNYKICETNQEEWTNTQPGTEEPCYEVNVKSGNNDTVEFGNMLKKSSINVTKFNDQNQNGYFDKYEVALPDWTITLTPEYMCDVYETDTLSLVSAFVEEIDCPVALSMEQVTDGNGETTFSDLYSGVYKFDEIEQDNWTKTNRYCEVERRSTIEGIVKVSPGETVNCYIGNYQAPSINVVKTGPSSASAGTEVTYTFTVTNTGGSSLSDITVVDSITGNATYVSGDNGDNVLDVTETWIYTAKYMIPVNQLADVVNTVQACGFELMYQDDIEFNVVSFISDEGQNGYEEQDPVCDTDDHSLSIPKVLGETTPPTVVVPPAVLATTGEDTSYALTTGALLIAAALLTGFKRRTVKVPAR